MGEPGDAPAAGRPSAIQGEPLSPYGGSVRSSQLTDRDRLGGKRCFRRDALGPLLLHHWDWAMQDRTLRCWASPPPRVSPKAVEEYASPGEPMPYVATVPRSGGVWTTLGAAAQCGRRELSPPRRRPTRRLVQRPPAHPGKAAPAVPAAPESSVGGSPELGLGGSASAAVIDVGDLPLNLQGVLGRRRGGGRRRGQRRRGSAGVSAILPISASQIRAADLPPPLPLPPCSPPERAPARAATPMVSKEQLPAAALRAATPALGPGQRRTGDAAAPAAALPDHQGPLQRYRQLELHHTMQQQREAERAEDYRQHQTLLRKQQELSSRIQQRSVIGRRRWVTPAYTVAATAAAPPPLPDAGSPPCYLRAEQALHLGLTGATSSGPEADPVCVPLAPAVMRTGAHALHRRKKQLHPLRPLGCLTSGGIVIA
eukprot:TRINITY_DN50123_c0_g1_i1.p1 TRINITY_DN50123_c0_g1~~TRINITY_DN50123_c0_g1_i1.p1  ORF type:complete len:427 (+),score=88.62 TRINITY_DN50123_c0_g1_i1:81-1361(+)